MKIPAGVDTGTRVQLTGEGEVGPGGGPAGDLYVEIHVAPHETFTRNGGDLHCTVTLPTLEADVVGGEEPTEHRPAARVDLARRLLLVADRRQLAQQLLLTGVETARGLDDHRDDEVAASAAQARHATAPEHLLGA